jgi:hypothetical protein
MTVTLTHDNYDGVCSLLLGNGALCTTVGPSGYHTAPESRCDTAHATQHFVLAGRRHAGPRHRLIDYGSLSRTLFINGKRATDDVWSQSLDCFTATALARLEHDGLTEETLSLVSMAENCFAAMTTLRAERRCSVRFDLLFTMPEESLRLGPQQVDLACVTIRTATDDDQGTIRVMSHAAGVAAPRVFVARDAVRFSYTFAASPGTQLTIRTLVQFSDRTTYNFPVTLDIWDELIAGHRTEWRSYHQASSLVTGDSAVDAFRTISLYTIRAQLTDWSIGPTLSEPYWGGGAFHDEMYPFLALISANHPELAARMPRFRLLTLDRAIRRGLGRGALYPWSSTEAGEERDPEGLWLTERFHLAQFSAETWALWLYERDLEQLRELYPVLREIARFYESTVIEPTEDGALGTRPCVDFDESVGAVRNGPFTISGAAAALRWAAAAARLLQADETPARRWQTIADALQKAVVTARAPMPENGEVFAIPIGVSLHYSVLGHIFPFATEVLSERAMRTARYIHRVCRSSHGWKPGMSDAYTGSNWTWTAGHLAAVHAMHANAELAWEAVHEGPSASGPGPVPCEHLDRRGVPRVPWFTTGVGAWVYGLHAAVAWLDDDASNLLCGIPEHLDALRFAGIRTGHGVAVSGVVQSGARPTLHVRSEKPVSRWRFVLPQRLADRARVMAQQIGSNAIGPIYETELPEGRDIVLVEPQTILTGAV